jgi:hypothetical protein
MKKFLTYSVACLLLTIVCGCASDPSKDDLKSPCVSNDLDGNAPCARRNLIENYLA